MSAASKISGIDTGHSLNSYISRKYSNLYKIQEIIQKKIWQFFPKSLTLIAGTREVESFLRILKRFLVYLNNLRKVHSQNAIKHETNK